MGNEEVIVQYLQQSGGVPMSLFVDVPGLPGERSMQARYGNFVVDIILVNNFTMLFHITVGYAPNFGSGPLLRELLRLNSMAPGQYFGLRLDQLIYYRAGRNLMGTDPGEFKQMLDGFCSTYMVAFEQLKNFPISPTPM